MTAEETGLEIAIVGAACRFPGAPDLDAYWRLLCSGEVAIRSLDEEELRAAGVPADLLADPSYVRAGAVIPDEDLFDAEYFGYSPRDAQLIDPQHRLFLQCVVTALEHGAQDPAAVARRVGVFASASANTYLLNNVWPHPALRASVGDFAILLGGEKDYLASRVAYKLDLRGPAVTVQTACSSSLVAVHLAAQSLLAGDCDLAVAGGSTVRVPQRVGHLAHESGIGSPDGQCRAFDADAAGTITGNGVGAVVLKRLRDAIADRDPIVAVILGSAINNDGADKLGFTAPSAGGQTEAIRAALAAAEVSAASIGYVEAHGTGTPLGDPIEFAALTAALGGPDQAGARCGLGAVKAVVGHLDAAAGVAGLIKAALAVRHGVIPPHPTFRRPNPNVDLVGSRFFINTEPRPWAVPGPRHAAVSSFGIGGTNAHLVLREPPPPPAVDDGRPTEVVLLSARSPQALEAAAEALANVLVDDGAPALSDIAYTTQTGRAARPYRRAVVATDRAAAAAALRSGQGVAGGPVDSADRGPVLLFAGQGVQDHRMTATLHRHDQVFRSRLEQCLELLPEALATELGGLLLAGGDDAAQRLRRTELAQPALFMTGYALAESLRARGVTPAAVLGHSVGEYVAAQQAGVLSLPDALRVVAARGRLIGALEPGAMLAVPLPEAELTDLLGPRSALAAVNTPTLCVASGPVEEIDALARTIEGQGVRSTRLHTSHAFHSPAMAAAAGPFAEVLASVSLQPPTMPIVSDLTGTWLSAGEATDPDYWVRHLREPVRFARGVQTLLQHGLRTFVDTGPRPVLGRLVLAQDRQATVVSPAESCERHSEAGLDTVLAELWASGVEVDWRAGRGAERRRREHLPTYCFQGRRHWIDPPRPTTGAASGLTGLHWQPRPQPQRAPSARVRVVGAGPWHDAVKAELARRDRAAAAPAKGTTIVVSAEPARVRDILRAGDTDPTSRLLMVTSRALQVESSDEVDSRHLDDVAEAVRTATEADLPWLLVDVGPGSAADIAPQLVAELGTADGTGQIAYRGRRRWVRVRVPVPESEVPVPVIEQDERWLVVGPSPVAPALAETLGGRDTASDGAAVTWVDPAAEEELARTLAGSSPDVLVWVVAAGTVVAPDELAARVRATRERIERALGERSCRRVALVDAPAGPGELVATLLEQQIGWTTVRSRHAGHDVRRWLPALGAVLSGAAEHLLLEAEPDPASPATDPADGHEEPATATERRLARIWQALLGDGDYRPEDDFFRVGGHSLTATQMMARIRAEFGVEVAMAELLEGSTLAAMAARIDAAPPVAPATPKPSADAGPAPLTAAQLNLWFLQQLAPASSFYALVNNIRFAGPLEPDALRRALGRVVERHEILRTVFPRVGRRPAQVVRPADEPSMPLVDLGDLDARTRADEMRRHAATLARQVSDVTNRPPLAATLLRVAPAEHVLCLAVHHIAADYWSLGILVDELLREYDRERRGAAARTEPPLRYSDVARWEAEHTGASVEQELEHWASRLADVPPPLALPTDLDRPARPTYAGGNAPVRLSADTSAGIRRLAEDLSATPFMVLLAAYAAFLHSVSGEGNLCVGSYLARRDRPEFEQMVGLFARTLPFPIRVRPEWTFRELVAEARQECLAVYRNQNVPLSSIVRRLNLPHDASRNPLFQTMLVFETAPAPSLELPGLDVSVEAAELGTAKVDLMLVLYSDTEAYHGFLEYSADLFHHDTVVTMAGHLQAVCEELVSTPDKALVDLVCPFPPATEAITAAVEGQ